jgi:hypothetical protein
MKADLQHQRAGRHAENEQPKSQRLKKLRRVRASTVEQRRFVRIHVRKRTLETYVQALDSSFIAPHSFGGISALTGVESSPRQLQPPK